MVHGSFIFSIALLKLTVTEPNRPSGSMMVVDLLSKFVP
jgi:hypothetical protein